MVCLGANCSYDSLELRKNMPTAIDDSTNYIAESFKSETYAKIPEHMRDALIRYVTAGIRPGDFLTAVICNNLQRAVFAADEENVHLLREYCLWFYNVAPSTCYGSVAILDAWVQRHAEE